MSRRFNTAGPNDPARHHTVPALSRVPGVREIIEQGSYFLLHAPRQMGKTTTLLDLVAVLNREGKYISAVLSLEPGAAMGSIDAAELAMLDSWRYDLAAYLPADVAVPRWPEAPPGNRIGAALSAFAVEAPRPLVIFLDGLDTLSREVRTSLIRQIRAGKPRRPRAFPWSIGFASMREPRELDVGQPPSSSASPTSSSGLEAELIALPPLTRTQVGELLAGLTERTGQEPLPGVIDRTYELTQGQPFLVNAFSQRLIECAEVCKGPLTAAEVEKAKDLLLDRRGGLLDDIADRIGDPKLQAALAHVMSGVGREPPPEDLRLAIDLGLVRRTPEGMVSMSCPFWIAYVGRLLPKAVRSVFPIEAQPSWVRPDGQLDPELLLEAFLEFWRKNADTLFSNAQYGELSPLVLTAFLNRVVKSGGLIEREYAIGRGRMDVCIRQGGAAIALVVKVRRDRDPDPVPEGLGQVDEALDRLGVDKGWLVVFDRRKGLSPVSQRLGATKEKTPAGREIVLVRA